MAGIGFSLRKVLREDDTYGTRVRAWFHTSIVAAGPWIVSILTINLMLLFSRRWDIPFVERELLITTVIYSTLFSQLLTAPFQMLITRYIADRIFAQELEYIKPSFWGVSLIVLVISLGAGLLFYRNSGLPPEYIYLALALFVLLTILWMLTVYLSTLKNYNLITSANVLGAVVTFLFLLLFSRSPLQFKTMAGTTNLLLAYLLGMFMILLLLLIAFLAELSEDNGKVFHFFRYFHSVPSLWPIGLLYTASLWADNVLMWFSPISISLFGVYRYAPPYDIATFYAYLITLPATMMFMVLIETDFYVQCREFFLAVLENAPLGELRAFARRMRESLFQDVLKTFEVQLFISILAIVLSPTFFPLLNISETVRRIFMIYALGALCNSFILIFLQVLLYIGERNRALWLMIIFFTSNVFFTAVTIPMGEAFYGSGFFLATFFTMLAGAVIAYLSYYRVIRFTFMSQPVYTREREKVFEKLEKWVDDRMTARDAFELKVLRRRNIERAVPVTVSTIVVDSKRAGSLATGPDSPGQLVSPARLAVVSEAGVISSAYNSANQRPVPAYTGSEAAGTAGPEVSAGGAGALAGGAGALAGGPGALAGGPGALAGGAGALAGGPEASAGPEALAGGAEALAGGAAGSTEPARPSVLKDKGAAGAGLIAGAYNSANYRPVPAYTGDEGVEAAAREAELAALKERFRAEEAARIQAQRSAAEARSNPAARHPVITETPAFLYASASQRFKSRNYPYGQGAKVPNSLIRRGRGGGGMRKR